MRLSTLVLIVLAFLLSPTASGQHGANNEPYWRVGFYNMDVRTTTRPDYTYQGVYAFAINADGPQVMLSCSAQAGLQTTVFMNETTMDEAFKTERKRPQARQVTMSVEGMADRRDPWGYIRSDKVLFSGRSWQAKRMYNAVVLGKPVVLDVAKVGEVTVNPPASSDAFKAFIRECPEIQ